MAKKFKKIRKLVNRKPKKVDPKLNNTSEIGVLPRITSDTVAKHREEILSGARGFIYPLQHTKKKIVIISTSIVLSIVVVTVVVSGLLLYRYQSTSRFATKVSEIIPFPISKVDGSYIPYKDYYFELGYSLFYFQNYDQEGVDINTTEGQLLVKQLKTKALEKIKLDKIARQLATEHGIIVTDEQIDKQIDVIRKQGGIGSSDKVLEEILKSSYNWGIGDLRHTIELQLIRQSLPSVLDTETVDAANKALTELNEGANFIDLVKKYSQDELTKDAKGVVGLISRTDEGLPPEFLDPAFALKEGETSQLVESRVGLHIIKINKIDGDQREIAHILFKYFDVEQFLKDELAKVEVVDYITP